MGKTCSTLGEDETRVKFNFKGHVRVYGSIIYRY
jgi:hypothetical protein